MLFRATLDRTGCRIPSPVFSWGGSPVVASIYGKRIGSALLKDAPLRPAHWTDTIGVRARASHKDDAVRTLYEHSTFEANPKVNYRFSPA
jgi:hypothetical protein